VRAAERHDSLLPFPPHLVSFPNPVSTRQVIGRKGGGRASIKQTTLERKKDAHPKNHRRRYRVELVTRSAGAVTGMDREGGLLLTRRVGDPTRRFSTIVVASSWARAWLAYWTREAKQAKRKEQGVCRRLDWADHYQHTPPPFKQRCPIPHAQRSFILPKATQS
jgi:hypothetical protein